MRSRTSFRSLRLLLLLLPISFASEAGAVGRISLSWDECSPILSSKSSGGAHPYRAFASVIGHSEAHRAYQWSVYLTTSPPSGVIPDAWRFDPEGCQGSSLLRIDHLPTDVAETCPAFVGGGQSLQIKEVSYDPTVGVSRILLAVVYPAGVPATDPNVRYFLGRIEFDHTFSVVGDGTPGADPGDPALTCGGFERDLRLSFARECGDPRFCSPIPPSWVDPGGTEHEFEIADPSITFCGSCGPTIATPSSWGEIKGRYRR